MVSQEEALRLLEHARDYEEKLIKDLNELLGQTISRMRLSPERDAAMRAMWKKLVSDSERHESEFQEMVDYVKGAGKDVY